MCLSLIWMPNSSLSQLKIPCKILNIKFSSKGLYKIYTVWLGNISVQSFLQQMIFLEKYIMCFKVRSVTQRGVGNMSKSLRNSLCLIGVLSIAAALYGCKAAPVEKETSFLPNPEKLQDTKGGAVQKVWKDPNINLLSYDKVIVVPVFTEDQLQKSWLERNNIRHMLGDDDKDLLEFAKYTENAFKKAIAADRRLSLVTKPGPKTLILELALVKVVPGKPIIAALGNLSNLTPFGVLLVPLKVGAKASADSPMQASVAIEGIVRDSQTKKVIGMFADREKQKAAVFNFNDFRAYSNLKQIVDEWAMQFVEAMNRKPDDPRIKDSKVFVPVNF